jgi:hypothetical protein
MDLTDFLRGKSFRSKYERKFAVEVLAKVQGLDFSSVSHETPFKDLRGRPRRIDFTIEEPKHVRIAIEVDGYDKTGSGHGMTRSEFKDWSLKESSMVAEGWRVLRFANTLVNHETGHCVRAVELTLEAERNIARQLDRGSEASERLSSIEAERQRIHEQLSAASRSRTRESELLRRIEDLEAERREMSIATLSAGEQKELRELEATIAERDALKNENSRMKTVVVAAVVLVAAVAAIVVALSREGGKSEADTGSEAALGASKCSDAVPWDQAEQFVDENAVVRGPVISTTYASETEGSPTYLNIGRDYPDKERFVVVIFGDDRENFRGQPEDTYGGKEVAIEGEVSSYNGSPEIIANHQNDIAIC